MQSRQDNNMLAELQRIIQERKANPKPDSYTNSLFDAGVNRIAQKVGEEATEVIVASLGQDRQSQVNEVSDLLYHTLVLLAELDIPLEEVYAELERRHKR